MLLTAREAAAYLGYDSVAQFRRAVHRGRLPKPFDPDCKEPRWSRPLIDAYLQGDTPGNRRETVSDLDRNLGLAG